MFSYLESLLESLAGTIPIEIFVFIASFIEEVVAPIPSPTVMIITGTLAKIQDYSIYMLLPLVILGAIGKTLGAVTIYFIANKTEHLIIHKYGRFLNITYSDITKLGEKLNGGIKDYILLTTLRALPFIPSVIISVGGGLLRIPLTLFIVSTFLGTMVRDSFYIYTGYIGAEALSAIINNSANIETYIEILVITLLLSFIGYRIYLRKKATKN